MKVRRTTHAHPLRGHAHPKRGRCAVWGEEDVVLPQMRCYEGRMSEMVGAHGAQRYKGRAWCTVPDQHLYTTCAVTHAHPLVRPRKPTAAPCTNGRRPHLLDDAGSPPGASAAADRRTTKRWRGPWSLGPGRGATP